MWHSIVFTMMTRNQDDQCHPVEDWLDMIRMITVACYTAAMARDAQLCADCCDSLVNDHATIQESDVGFVSRTFRLDPVAVMTPLLLMYTP